jgi:hypothetical protein
VPTREERALTAARLAALPEMRALGPPRPVKCECGVCDTCRRRLYGRFYRRTESRLGYWTSSRARAARDARRLTGMSWSELADRYGYASAATCRESVLMVARSEVERGRLRRGGRWR